MTHTGAHGAADTGRALVESLDEVGAGAIEAWPTLAARTSGAKRARETFWRTVEFFDLGTDVQRPDVDTHS